MTPSVKRIARGLFGPERAPEAMALLAPSGFNFARAHDAHRAARMVQFSQGDLEALERLVGLELRGELGAYWPWFDAAERYTGLPHTAWFASVVSTIAPHAVALGWDHIVSHSTLRLYPSNGAGIGDARCFEVSPSPQPGWVWIGRGGVREDHRDRVRFKIEDVEREVVRLMNRLPASAEG